MRPYFFAMYYNDDSDDYSGCQFDTTKLWQQKNRCSGHADN